VAHETGDGTPIHPRRKKAIRAYALNRERAIDDSVFKVRLLRDGDVRAYCKGGYDYLIAPTAVLFAELQHHSRKVNDVEKPQM
jgi:hypothetical protein